MIPTAGQPVDWMAARAAMLLDPSVINLNTGSFGPLPKSVFDVATALRKRLAEEPMDFLLRQAPPLLWQARERLATYLGADPRRLAFTANVTAAINTIAAGLRLASPGEILLTDHEYGAMHWCWERAAVRQGLTLRTFPLPSMAQSPAEIVDAARAAFSDRTRAFFFSHVLSPTGLVLPAGELCAEARRRGILTVVDGAHAPGMVPLELDAIGSDFYGGNLHKWVLAPTGTGFLYFGPGAEERIQPLQVSWGWHRDRARPDDRDEFGSTPRLRAYEFEGIRDPSPWLAVPAALDFLEGIGFAAIRRRIEELMTYTRRALADGPGLPLATPVHPELHGAMTAFRLPPGREPAEWRKRVWEVYRIEVPIIERPNGLLVRLSTHFYNTEAEVDRCAAAFAALVGR